MPRLIPFAATRAPRSLAGLVSTRTYKSYSKTELKQKLNTNKFSFLHVIKVKNEEKQKLKKIKDNFHEFLQKKIFIKDEIQSLYIYQQEIGNQKFFGVIGLVSVEDYEKSRIIKHENTLEKRETLFSKYLDTVHFQAEPILLARNQNKIWDEIMTKTMKQRPESEFATSDGVFHKIWVLSKSDSETIRIESESMKKFYVADGHHRLSSSVKSKSCNHILSLIIDSKQLNISPFYRFIKGKTLNNKDWTSMVEVKFLGQAPKELPKIGIYALDKRGWWHINNEKIRFPESKWINENLFSPIWGIKNERNEERIRYLEGTQNMKKIESLRNNDEVMFVSSRPSWEEVKDASDKGVMLPPKSTYIEPKLRSGMIIFSWS